MATTQYQTVSMRASAAVDRGDILQVSGAGTVAKATAATDPIVGIAVAAAPAGAAVDVAIDGIALVRASAAIAVGARVTATTGGAAVATTTAGDYSIGITLEAATAANDLIRVAVQPVRL